MATDDDIGSADTSLGTETLLTSPGAGPTDVPAPSMIADRYEILGLLGMGGMGRVYRAHDRTLDEHVALKLLRRELLDTPGVLERFRQEVKLARRVTHTHVVRTFDLGQHQGEHFLTMELIEGRSLAALIDEGPLELDEVLRIARAICDGIAAAHAVGVLHRDLKPDNVLVARTGRVVLTDFGIARIDAGGTLPGERFMGTPAYMAPEQVDGSGRIGPATDVYAFGAIMFEMITGRRAFAGGDPFAVALARLHQPPPDPRRYLEVPDPLASLVVRCLARDPAQRFADAGAVAAALGSLSITHATPASYAPPLPGRTSRAIAVLPLRATAELAELAEGLSEEIVDALSLTRALRVRPLASVKRHATAGDDPRELGQALGVDVIVDGALRRRGDQMRITARAIGVADGFQLWAGHVDALGEGLLGAGDDVARAVARALTIELAMPERAASDARATELYLEGKARLRAEWLDGRVAGALEVLERAYAVAPEDPRVLATHAMALARSGFFGDQGSLVRARALADQAVLHAPALGETWLAQGVAALYSGAMADAARALVRAVTCAPGLALAQAMLGGVLLEAGELESAIAHLEGANALDPGSARADLPRAYVYAGRHDDARREIAAIPERTFAELQTARFELWEGRTYDIAASALTSAPADLRLYAEALAYIHRTRQFAVLSREVIDSLVLAANPRARATRCQFLAELYAFTGNPEAAIEYIVRGVEGGLHDHLWFEHCPMLDGLRDRPELAPHRAVVAARAQAVLEACRAALTLTR